MVKGVLPISEKFNFAFVQQDYLIVIYGIVFCSGFICLVWIEKVGLYTTREMEWTKNG